MIRFLLCVIALLVCACSSSAPDESIASKEQAVAHWCGPSEDSLYQLWMKFALKPGQSSSCPKPSAGYVAPEWAPIAIRDGVPAPYRQCVASVYRSHMCDAGPEETVVAKYYCAPPTVSGVLDYEDTFTLVRVNATNWTGTVRRESRNTSYAVCDKTWMIDATFVARPSWWPQ